MAEPLRLALYQGPSPAGDIDAAFDALATLMAAASAARAQIAVAPELFLPGYNAAEMTADPAWPLRLAAIAQRYRIALVVGLAEAEGDDLSNAAHAYGPDGTLLARYAKRQLFGRREAALFRPGDALASFAYRGRRIGLLVCYDVEFAPLLRAHAAGGCDTILVPTANMIPFDTISRFVVPAQALMHAVSIAYANYCGSEGDLDYCGGSVIAGPDGEPLAQAGRGPAILITEIPASDASQLRPLSTQAHDWRPL